MHTPRSTLNPARSLRFLAALACSASVFSLPALAADSAAASAPAASTGVVEGRVFNAASGMYVTNARVTVEGTSIQAFTSDTGEYRLRGVPAGNARIKVSYTGQPDLVETVAVGGTAAATANFTFASANVSGDASTVRLDAFVVESGRYRNAQDIATNEERTAANIKSVVALDSLGYVADGNVGSFIRFLPGVDVAMGELVGVRNNPDNAVSVGVRGFGPNDTAVLIDGVPIASGSPDNVSRTVQLDALSVNNASRVEIIKVATPDMPQNSPGGAINLITRGAFELSRPTYDLSIALNATTNALEGFQRTPGPGEDRTFKTQPNIRFSAGIPLSKQLGVSFSFATDNRYSSTNYSRMRDPFLTAQTTPVNGTANLIPVTNAQGGIRIDNPVIDRFELNDFQWLENRFSGNVRVDWRPSSNLELRFNGQFSTVDSTGINHRSQWRYNGADGIRDWGDGFVTGYQRTPTFNPNDSVQMTIDWRDRYGFTTQGYINGKYRLGLWAIDAQVGASEAYNASPDLANGHFSNADVNITPGRMDLTDINKGVVGAIRLWDANGAPMEYGRLTSWQPIVTTGYRARSSESYNRDLIKRYSLDVGRELDFFPSIPISLKAGGLQEEKKNHRWGRGVTYETRYIGPAVANLDVETDYAGDAFGGYASPQHWVDLAKVYNLYQANPQNFDDQYISATGNVNAPAANYQSRVNNTKGIKITTTDYYGMATARLFRNRVTIITGARQSRKDTSGYNVYNDPQFQFVKKADGTLYRDSAYPAGVRFDGAANSSGQPRDAILTDTALRQRLQAAGVPFIPNRLELAPDGTTNGSAGNNLLLAMRARTLRDIDSSLTQPWQPQVQVAYDVTDNIKLQVAWSKETRLPELDGGNGILVGGASFQINQSANPTTNLGGDGTITISNVKGIPEINESYNAKLSWYPRNGMGRYAISYYYKNVEKSWETLTTYNTDSNYDSLLGSMGLTSDDYPNYGVTTVLPNGIPQVRKGFEIEAVQNLGLLGQWGRGFDTFLTYTRRPVTRVVRPNVLGFIEEVPVRAKWSGGVSYSARRWSLQARATYVERGIEYNGSGTNVTMPDGTTRSVQFYTLTLEKPDLNLQANYVFNKNVSFFATADHILSDKKYKKFSDFQTGLTPEWFQWREMSDSGVRITIGAQMRLDNLRLSRLRFW